MIPIFKWLCTFIHGRKRICEIASIVKTFLKMLKKIKIKNINLPLSCMCTGSIVTIGNLGSCIVRAQNLKTLDPNEKFNGNLGRSHPRSPVVLSTLKMGSGCLSQKLSQIVKRTKFPDPSLYFFKDAEIVVQGHLLTIKL